MFVLPVQDRPTSCSEASAPSTGVGKTDTRTVHAARTGKTAVNHIITRKTTRCQDRDRRVYTISVQVGGQDTGPSSPTEGY